MTKPPASAPEHKWTAYRNWCLELERHAKCLVDEATDGMLAARTAAKVKESGLGKGSK